jgi:hypothetical protein
MERIMENLNATAASEEADRLGIVGEEKDKYIRLRNTYLVRYVKIGEEFETGYLSQHHGNSAGCWTRQYLFGTARPACKGEEWDSKGNLNTKYAFVKPGAYFFSTGDELGPDHNPVRVERRMFYVCLP